MGDCSGGKFDYYGGNERGGGRGGDIDCVTANKIFTLAAALPDFLANQYERRYTQYVL